MLVIDTSIAAAWLFDDESDAIADDAISSLEFADGLAPLLWRYEIRNLLLMGVRRERLDYDMMIERLSAVENLPIIIDGQANLNTALRLAQKHKLSFYDALYLELAMRKTAQLASLDKTLVEAALEENIAVFSAN